MSQLNYLNLPLHLWYCNVCDKTMKKTSKHNHIKTKKHCLRISPEPVIEPVIEPAIEPAIEPIPIQLSENQWHCQVCDIQILKSSKSGHLRSKRHQKNVDTLQKRWHCTVCNISVKTCNKHRHIHSKNHKRLFRLAQELKNKDVPKKECTICFKEQPKKKFKKCVRCVYDWCSTCHGEMSRCPYCRKNFPRRTRLSNG